MSVLAESKLWEEGQLMLDLMRSQSLTCTRCTSLCADRSVWVGCAGAILEWAPRGQDMKLIGETSGIFGSSQIVDSP